MSIGNIESQGVSSKPFPVVIKMSRWRHQIETFSALLALCEGNFTSQFPSQRPLTRSYDIFFDLRQNKTVEQTIETPTIWDAIALIMTLL